MTEQMITAIKQDEAFSDFRKKWNLDEVHERKNGFDASLVSRTAKGWMEATQLNAETDESEQDEEMRQEWVDFHLDQAEERLQITGKIKNCRYILSCETAVHTLKDAKNGKDAYCYTAVYSHESGSAMTPIGKHYTADSKETLKLAEHMCKALIELHRADAVHKCICPENIFRLEDGTYCLGRAGVEDDVENLKKSGFYPRETYDAQSDIFMLGQCLARIHQTDKLSSREARRLTAIINKACDSEASMRYRSAEEMLAAVENRMGVKKTLLFGIIGGIALTLILVGAILISTLGKNPEPEKPQDSQTEQTTQTATETTTEETNATETTATETPAETETTQAPTESETSGVAGDSNNDGSINVFDAVKVLEMTLTGQNEGENMELYDVNGDGEVNVLDSAELLRYSAYSATGGAKSFDEYIANKED